MDLESLNKEYVQLKNELGNVSKDILALETKANNLATDKIIWNGKLAESKKIGNVANEKIAQTELKRIDDELKVVQDETIKKKDAMKRLQIKVNIRMDEIKENPEMKQHLNEVMQKKYSRKISKLEKEKDETIEKRDRLKNLRQLVTEHPSLGNNLKGVLGAQKEITDLKKELDDMKIKVGTGLVSYKNPNRANEIINTLLPQAKSKMLNNKTSLMAYISKNKLNITEKDIEELAERGLSIDSKGKIDINTTMDKNIGTLNRQIKGYDKSIKNHQIALDSIEKEEQSLTNESSSISTQNKQKWYQVLVQRVKNWYEGKSRQALPEPKIPKQTPEVVKNNENNSFRESLKFDVVKDTVDKEVSENLKQAKEKRKEEEYEIS